MPSPIRLRRSEDECLCPVALVKEYLAKTKDREQRSEKLFVTRKIGPVISFSNAMIAKCLEKTLTLANIRASGGSTRKAVIFYPVSQGASIKTIMEAGDWVDTSTMCNDMIIIQKCYTITGHYLLLITLAKIHILLHYIYLLYYFIFLSYIFVKVDCIDPPLKNYVDHL